MSIVVARDCSRELHVLHKLQSLCVNLDEARTRNGDSNGVDAPTRLSSTSTGAVQGAGAGTRGATGARRRRACHDWTRNHQLREHVVSCQVPRTVRPPPMVDTRALKNDDCVVVSRRGPNWWR